MVREAVRLGHVKADVMWGLALGVMAWQKRFTLPRKELPSATAERFPRAAVRRSERVPMRDGVTLATDVYLPADANGRPQPQAAPAILIRMPYGIREPYAYMPAVGRFWARRGYACVIQDVRGKFDSGGEWDPFLNEVDDGYDAVEWVSNQPWCDGRVGMTGESYYGYTQWAAAAARHPALVCISPGDMGVDVQAMVYQGGALALSTLALWACDQAQRRYINFFRFDTRHLPLRTLAEDAGLPTRLYDQVVEHPVRDELWDGFDLSPALPGLEIPVFLWSGWYDNLLPGVLDCWEKLEADTGAPRESADARRHMHRLVLGPTDHETTTDFSLRVGRIELPEGERSWDRVLAFFDRHLAGRPPGEAGGAPAGGAGPAETGGAAGGPPEPRVRAYVVGAGRWREADDWPLPGTAFTPLYLSGSGGAAGGGRLVPEPPPAAPPDVYVYDPLDPPAWWEGRDVWAAAKHLGDRSALNRRPDVLVYSTPPLAEPLEVVGPLSAVLHVASSAPDTDFVVTLCDVWPDGYAQLVQQGIQRLRYRDGATRPALADPGRTYTLTVDLAATGHLFAAGHRVGVQVASAEFDRWDRNPNTGHEFGADAETVPATQSVYHDAERPSHLLLPVNPERELR